MTLLIASFLAGVLTVAAPCILPLLPVVVGGSIASDRHPSRRHPLVITASLALSIIFFTLLLKASTALLAVPHTVWASLSGAIIGLLGLTFALPNLWERIAVRLGFNTGAQSLLGASYARTGTIRDIALGAALGPVFNSCSPTYLLIVAVILPRSWQEGLLYLGAYVVGLATTLLLAAYGGQTITRRFRWITNPNGWSHRSIGLLLIIVGISIVIGLDREIQAWIIDHGWYAPVGEIDAGLRSQR